MTRAAFVLLIAAVACGKAADSGASQAKAPTGKEILADVAASKSLPPEHYASPTAGFDLTLPGVWTGHYRTQEVKDTTDGARLGVIFRFLPDSGSRAPQETLMTVRVFSQKAWKAAIRPGSLPIGSVLAERGDDVFVLSLPRENPYPAGTAEALGYDRLLISIAQGGKQVDLTPHVK